MARLVTRSSSGLAYSGAIELGDDGFTGTLIPVEPPPPAPPPEPAPQPSASVRPTAAPTSAIDAPIPPIVFAPPTGGPTTGENGPPTPLPSGTATATGSPGAGAGPIPSPSPTVTRTPPPPADTPVRPANDPSGWVTTGDYRTSWIRRELEGTVGVALAVGANGRVTDCRVTRSSGHSQLDQATCALVTRRARFDPATSGRTGAAMAGDYRTAVQWRLPR